MRMNSCSFDISRLNMPTVLPASMPQCSAMFSTKLVLPIDGRAATMTRSDFWKPEVISSRSTKPLGTPVTRPAVLLQLLDQLIAGIDELADADEAGAHAVLGDLEDRPLGFVEQVVGVLLGVVGARPGRRWPTGSAGAASTSP